MTAPPWRIVYVYYIIITHFVRNYNPKIMINMKTLTKSKFTNKYRLIIIALLASVAGVVNGFLGTGGGIVLMLALSLVPAQTDDAVRDRFATVIAVILPLSLVSAFVYESSVELTAASVYLIPGILGGITGALLLERVSVGFVKKLFAVMVIWAGINFIA